MMPQQTPNELIAAYRHLQRSQLREHASNQLRLFARSLFAALNKKEVRGLYQKAKGYLEQCMEEHQKRANDPARDGDALDALLNQAPEPGSDRYLDEI